ncbi:MAG: thrombospondin type 3 repeat-containing protein [Myxococcota bacterium]
MPCFKCVYAVLLSLSLGAAGCSSIATTGPGGEANDTAQSPRFDATLAADASDSVFTEDSAAEVDLSEPTDDGSVEPSADTDSDVDERPIPDATGPNLGSEGGDDAIEPPPPADTDADGLPDDEDNCPEDNNPDQADADGDQVGDACDPDIDGDGTDNQADNCPVDSNPAQGDSDQDDIGDLCDSDKDGDGVENGEDNCPDLTNTAQADGDQDGLGDVCDSDADGDDVTDDLDNCPGVSNAEQADEDGDSIGDACEPDTDDDGTPDDWDNCPMTANADQADEDQDDIGDACEPDIDSDGTPDDTDNCPTLPNSDQADKDGDGIGDACEPDGDADNIPDDDDNCPNTPNNNQADADNDGIGNACETDGDMDGIPDDSDLFPGDPNLPGAADTAFIYPHTSSKLYALNANTISLTEVGSFMWPNDGGNHQMTDLALDSYGTIFGVSFSHLYTCHPDTVVCTSLGSLPGSYNGLTMLPPGTLDPDLDVLVAISTGGQWYRLEVNGGVVSATLLGSYGSGYTSSGDAYAIAGVGTFAAVNAPGSSADVLVALIPETGAVDYEISAIGNYSNVWGLAGWLGRAYAFDSSGDVLRIDLATGVVTTALETNHSWWGAGVATQIP